MDKDSDTGLITDKQKALLLVEELYSSFEHCKRRCGEIKLKCERTQERVALIGAQKEMNEALVEFTSRAETIKTQGLHLMKNAQVRDDEERIEKLLKQIGEMK